MTDIIKLMCRGKTPPQTVIQEAMRPASKGFTLMSTRRGPGSEETGVRADWEGSTSKGTFPHTHSIKVYCVCELGALMT